MSCTAVGGYGNNGNAKNALAGHWNGTAWTVQATMRPADALNSTNSVSNIVLAEQS